MAVHGPEKAATGRTGDGRIWIGPDGSGAVCVDLRGSVAWLSQDPPWSVADWVYVGEVARELGFRYFGAIMQHGAYLVMDLMRDKSN